MLHDILFALWFFLPAGAANLAPVLAAKAPLVRAWDTPMDLGRIYRGKRILGAHKTWRGLVVGMLVATLILWLQQLLVAHTGWAATLARSVDYVVLPVLIVGPLFGLGALGGDAIESFFKRQRNVPPGHGWFPFDQIDYIIGGAIATAPFVTLSLWQYAWLMLLWLVVHVIASYIGYLLHLKERPI
ncbi:MAG TPA: CDP-archaeol synthase [Candidatus Saccharimonadales bacterium]|nr:CDP-archaeol synthase [Candidatus Saccharimonadales bacterium]